MRYLIVIGLCFLNSAVKAEEPNNWHLLTRSYGGTVSLIKGLSKTQCDEMSLRVRGLPLTAEEWKGMNGFTRTIGDGDIQSAECFQ